MEVASHFPMCVACLVQVIILDSIIICVTFDKEAGVMCEQLNRFIPRLHREPQNNTHFATVAERSDKVVNNWNE
jgi:hypothetical protein